METGRFLSLSTRTPAGIQTEKSIQSFFWLNAWSNYTRDFRFDIKSRRKWKKKWDFKRGDSFGTLNRPRERHPLYLVPTGVENGSSLRDQGHVPMISMQARMNFFSSFFSTERKSTRCGLSNIHISGVPSLFFTPESTRRGERDFFFSIYTNTHKSIDIPQRITSLADRFDSSVYLFKKKKI